MLYNNILRNIIPDGLRAVQPGTLLVLPATGLLGRLLVPDSLDHPPCNGLIINVQVTNHISSRVVFFFFIPILCLTGFLFALFWQEEENIHKKEVIAKSLAMKIVQTEQLGLSFADTHTKTLLLMARITVA